MQMRNLTQKTLFKMLAVLLLAGLALVLFHHHADGQHTSDCAICRLAVRMFGIVLLAAASIVRMIAQRTPASTPKTLFSLLLTPNLLGRAPPALS